MDIFVQVGTIMLTLIFLMVFIFIYTADVDIVPIIFSVLTNWYVITAILVITLYFFTFNRVKFITKKWLTGKKIKDIELRSVYKTFNKVLPNCYVEVLIDMDKYLEDFTEELTELKQYVSMHTYLESGSRGLEVSVRNLAMDQLRGNLIDFIDLIDVKVEALKSGQHLLVQVESEGLVSELKKEFLKEEN